MSRQNNKLPLFIGLAAAGAALYLYLRNKASAGQNLRVEPVDALLNTAKTRQSLYTRLYYTVKLRLVNDEPAAVVVRGLNLAATANGRPFGNLVSAEPFTVPAKSAQTVSLNASVATLGALGAILDILRGGRSVAVSIVGYADTDLGRVNVEYQTELSAAGVSGKRAVNGPPERIDPTRKKEDFAYYGRTIKILGQWYQVYKKGKDLYYRDWIVPGQFVYLGPEKKQNEFGPLYKPH